LRPGATNWGANQGFEADVAVYTGASVFSRRGFMAVGYGNLHGTQDMAFEVTASTGWPNGAWVIGLGFSNDAGIWGVDNCGALISAPLNTGFTYTPCGSTVDHKVAWGIDLLNMVMTSAVIRGPASTTTDGIDFSAMTFLNTMFKGPSGFAITPNGGILGNGNVTATWPSAGVTQWALVDNLSNAGAEIDIINRQVSPSLASPTLEIIQMTGTGTGAALGTFTYSASGDTSRLGIGNVLPGYALVVAGTGTFSGGLAVGAVGVPTAGQINAGGYQATGVAGVSCGAGTVNLTTEVVSAGIVTHC
jgi:hypothetical protein